MKPIRLIVAGCRDFKNSEKIFTILTLILEKVNKEDLEIVSGGCEQIY